MTIGQIACTITHRLLGLLHTASKLKSFDGSDGRQVRRTYPLELRSCQIQHT
jgi:hypothetical protein